MSKASQQYYAHKARIAEGVADGTMRGNVKSPEPAPHMLERETTHMVLCSKEIVLLIDALSRYPGDEPSGEWDRYELFKRLDRALNIARSKR